MFVSTTVGIQLTVYQGNHGIRRVLFGSAQKSMSRPVAEKDMGYVWQRTESHCAVN
jgi:hypothetical protein